MSTKPFTVTLDEHVAEQARGHAAEIGLSFSALVDRALRAENARVASERWLAFLASGTPEATEVRDALEQSRRAGALHVGEKYGHLR